jgi:hypothetical protein
VLLLGWGRVIPSLVNTIYLRWKST